MHACIDDLIKKYLDGSDDLSMQEKMQLIEEIVFSDAKAVYMFVDGESGINYAPTRYVELNLKKRIMLAGCSVMCRARGISEVIENAVWEDFWAPPKKYAKDGRVNFSGESLLYLSDSPMGAISEIRKKETESFMLMFYNQTNDIDLTEIGFVENSVANKITDFLDAIFMTPNVDNKCIYEITNFIAKRYKNFGIGWVYPSVMFSGGINYCLLGEGAKNLNLVGAVNFIDGKICSKFDFSDRDNIKLIELNPIEAKEEWERLLSLANTTEQPYRNINEQDFESSVVSIIPRLAK